MNETLRPSLRAALSSYVLNGAATAIGYVLATAIVQHFFGPVASAAAAVGAIVVTPPDQPAPRRGKFTHLLPAAVIGTPLFLAVQMLRQDPLGLWLLLVGMTFVAFLGGAWGKRGLPVSISVIFSMIFALAAPPPADLQAALELTGWFALGAALYLVWGTVMNAVLNARYRVQAIAESLLAIVGLMRTQAQQFTLPPGERGPGDVTGRLMQQQAALADQLQTARNILLESPRTPRRLQLAGMLIQTLDMRDHLIACALDLDALRALPEQHELLQTLAAEIEVLADGMESVAEALLMGRVPSPYAHERPRLAIAAAAEAAPAEADLYAPPPQLLAGALARRVGYLHDEVGRLVALARGEAEPDVTVVRAAWQMFVSPTTWSLRPFLTLWRWDAPPLRHAIRAALAIGAGQAVASLLPWASHEYWILLTITVVLRGSLAQTLERRNARVAGTLLGSLIAGGLLASNLSRWVLLPITGLGQGIAHAFAVRRYLYTAVAATVMALVQAHMLAGLSNAFATGLRVVDTLIGALIAWVFSYVLPSWERTQVGALVARTLAAQAKHAELALGLGQLRAIENQAELAWRLARREAYDSLSALVQAIQRALSEPRAVRPRVEELERMLSHSYQLLAQLTAIKTMLLQRRDRLNFEQLQLPLQEATAAITAALAAPAAQANGVHTEAPPMLELPDPHEQDLSPWLRRRLRLAVSIANRLKADAQQALRDA